MPTVDDEGAVDPNVTFESLGLVSTLADACKQLGWKTPSKIQAESIPSSLSGKDVIALAETGSGKTGAFALPILQSLLDNPSPHYALVLTPTRELALQIGEQFEALGSSLGARTCVIVGGVDMMTQAIALMKKPHIVVATPGRIVDHFENTKGFHMRNLKYLVMDEADRMLTQDFEVEVDKILKVIPRDRRTFLFSATMTDKVRKLQRASLTNPVKIEVSKKYQTVEKLIQYYMFIPSKFKDCYLAWLLNENQGQSVIIFVSTCANAQRTAILLNNLGFSTIPLHGQMPQTKRIGSLNKFKSQNKSILIATDVASRGLDIPHVDIVVNFDIPTNSKDYIHRVGRTARAGRAGKSVTMVTQYDVELLQRIEKLIEKKLANYPSEEEEVMLMLERVTEAQRFAAMNMKDAEQAKKQGKRDREEMSGGGSKSSRGGKGGFKKRK
ncbi:ATP-dependent RNA helicase DDX47 [Sphaeroforma arctica JP610]|uniref:RNA helicase n=1 Tax=Sphaeroforma arctica JP610 TaxID=667725 RepID=A0A0L0FRL6_9EUKA|nr:ATP-dependent RNA helicase DDX47 [Sphaeroforma arctica JP610]KNC79415.1 ATP-dependent RNA helicase DDX47 [Sphaeroforma arctica JP610]|eukprot:XP_014153317.1 ATP-dependent RNA helicase DDX47 [Sphaeroforma arctica JP610]